MSFSSLGRLSRCSRANADRYAIIHNFFQPARAFPKPCLQQACRPIPLFATREFHLTATTFKKARSRHSQTPFPSPTPISPSKDPEEITSEDDLVEHSQHELEPPAPHEPPLGSIPPPSTKALPAPSNEPPTKDTTTPLAYNFENYSRFFRQLATSLPHLHRPTRDDFLNVATGFWQRANVRFKWYTIKSFRKFNTDDMSAFISMFLMSQTLWIFVGT